MLLKECLLLRGIRSPHNRSLRLFPATGDRLLQALGMATRRFHVTHGDRGIACRSLGDRARGAGKFLQLRRPGGAPVTWPLASGVRLAEACP
jgi:hypothetical protein